MGLFSFGKKKNKEYQYRMFFDSPIDDNRNQQIKTIALKYLGEAGVVINDVKTTSIAPDCSKADFTGESGECISFVCNSAENASSYISINVQSQVCAEEAIKDAFQKIGAESLENGFYFTEF